MMTPKKTKHAYQLSIISYYLREGHNYGTIYADVQLSFDRLQDYIVLQYQQMKCQRMIAVYPAWVMRRVVIGRANDEDLLSFKPVD